MIVFLYQVEDVVESLQLAVNDDLELSLVIQVGQQLDEGYLGHHIQVDGGDLPSALGRSVQDPLQHCQAWREREMRKRKGEGEGQREGEREAEFI